MWVSPAYEVAQEDVLQRFPIPPTLCVGGYLRVELLGRTQRQAIDDLYYSERRCCCWCFSALRAYSARLASTSPLPPLLLGGACPTPNLRSAG